MSTAAYQQPIYNRQKGTNMSSTQTTLKPHIAELVEKIRALRTVTKHTGFITNRTIGDMLKGLSADDLVAVGKALQASPEDFAHYIR